LGSTYNGNSITHHTIRVVDFQYQEKIIIFWQKLPNNEHVTRRLCRMSIKVKKKCDRNMEIP
jgi:hypothetical protein